MNRGGRAARSSASHLLGANDPRLRRNAQSGATDNDLGSGLELDPKGRIQVALDVQGALYKLPNGDLGLRLGDGLALTAGSPVAVRLVEADGTVQVTKKGLRARVTASQVTRSDGVTVEADLDAKQDIAEKDQVDGYLGINGFGYVDASKLGSGYAGAGAKYLADNGSYKALDIDSLTPTTTKGDLLVEDGSNVVRVPVGSDGELLMADSADAQGVAWTRRPMSILFWAKGDAAVTLTNLTAADSLTPATGVTINVKLVDLTGYRQCRLIVHRNSGTCGNGTTCTLKYYTALSATEANYLTIGSSAVSVLVDNTVGARPFVAVSSWIDLVAGAKADVYITPIFSGGDGASDPTFGYVEAQFR